MPIDASPCDHIFLPSNAVVTARRIRLSLRVLALIGIRPVLVILYAISLDEASTDGGEQLHRQRADHARAGESNGAAAQVVAEQVIERVAGTHDKTLPGGAVVLGNGRRAAADHGFGEAVKGDGVLDAAAVTGEWRTEER
jgi:hypothetical protein